jgi:dCTP diphosphatase
MNGPLESADRNREAIRMPNTTDTLTSLRERLAAFAAERDWEQFHNPKNLAMALTGEVGELVEHFQWLTFEQAQALPAQTRDEVALEAADVLLYLVRLCDTLGIDLAEAAHRKLALNAERYPVDKAHGRADKHDKL